MESITGPGDTKVRIGEKGMKMAEKFSFRKQYTQNPSSSFFVLKNKWA